MGLLDDDRDPGLLLGTGLLAGRPPVIMGMVVSGEEVCDSDEH